jgi:hypothetical protein
MELDLMNMAQGSDLNLHFFHSLLVKGSNVLIQYTPMFNEMKHFLT